MAPLNFQWVVQSLRHTLRSIVQQTPATPVLFPSKTSVRGLQLTWNRAAISDQFILNSRSNTRSCKPPCNVVQSWRNAAPVMELPTLRMERSPWLTQSTVNTQCFSSKLKFIGCVKNLNVQASPSTQLLTTRTLASMANAANEPPGSRGFLKWFLIILRVIFLAGGTLFWLELMSEWLFYYFEPEEFQKEEARLMMEESSYLRFYQVDDVGDPQLYMKESALQQMTYKLSLDPKIHRTVGKDPDLMFINNLRDTYVREERALARVRHHAPRIAPQNRWAPSVVILGAKGAAIASLLFARDKPDGDWIPVACSVVELVSKHGQQAPRGDASDEDASARPLIDTKGSLPHGIRYYARLN
eukprot:m.509491 g.509491  ORF g.509491 m.509491 type:complete len:357 (-) comp21889_c0_seq7:3082-4152(-)